MAKIRTISNLLNQKWGRLPIKLVIIQLVVIGSVIIIASIGVWVIRHNADSSSNSRTLTLSNAHVEWNMDAEAKDEIIVDSKGEHKAISFNTRAIKGHSGKARYFNGKNSYIATPVLFEDWKGVTISLWVMPKYKKDEDTLSVILENGHDAESNFVIQSADYSGEEWVWHCNGSDIFLTLPLCKWSHVVVAADAKKGTSQAYVNGIKMGEIQTEAFEFGALPLTFGRLTSTSERYFKGSIDNVVVWDSAVDGWNEEILKK